MKKAQTPDHNQVLPQSFYTFRIMPAVLLAAFAVRYSMAGLYTEMALLAGAAFGSVAQMVYLRDKNKAKPEAPIDLMKANRYLISLFCLVGAAMAYLNDALLIASLTLLAGLGQFWFKTGATAGERVWHGLQATLLAILGFMIYRPLMYVCLPASIVLAVDYMRLQKEETDARKALLAKQPKKHSRKKKKKK